MIMVTNQSGIGRGYYGWAEFKSVQDAIIASLAAEGARIDAVYACAHHPQAEGLLAHPDHPAQWSSTDLAEAHWVGCSYVITQVAAGAAAGMRWPICGPGLPAVGVMERRT